MRHPGISHARLMRESTTHVERALHCGTAQEQAVVQRLLADAGAFSLWEREHSTLMREVANHRDQRAQVVALKHTSFRLIHGKALFQYLRDSGVRGAARMRLISHFRPARVYENALVSEHHAFVRKACSYLCTNHVGGEVVRDPVFLDPMQRYEELFGEYFDIYCSSLVDASETETPSQTALLPLLKYRLNQWRAAILNPREGVAVLEREAELMRPTGETQRLPKLVPSRGVVDAPTLR